MSIANISVGNYSIRKVATIAHTETIGYALTLMNRNRFRRYPVVDDRKRLIGIVTATDIVNALHSPGELSIIKEPITSIMTTKVYTLQAYETLKEAISLMYNTGISGLPIMHDNDIIGIITEKDMIMLENLWFGIPDAMITENEGIGRKINQESLINEDFTLFQAIDKMLAIGQRQILIQRSDGNGYTGLFTIMRLLDYIYSKIVVDDVDYSTLQTTPVSELPNFPLLQKSSPVLVNSIRIWLNSRGAEAVPIFTRGKPVKLISEKDLVGYLYLKL